MRFAQIVKIKKLVLDDLENKMAKINSQIESVNNQISIVTQQLADTHRPTSGRFAEMGMVNSIIAIYKQDISNLKIHKQSFENLKIEIMDKIKIANIELEKVKYLEDQEKLAKLKKLQRLEAAELDEIGLILFNNKKAMQS